MKCKWCREDIEPRMEMESWSHKTGTFSCKYHPETIAEPADLRWENVFASSVTIPKNDPFPGLSGMTRLRIDVEIDGETVGNTTILDAIELEYALIDMYSFTINKMVYKIDIALDERKKSYG